MKMALILEKMITKTRNNDAKKEEFFKAINSGIRDRHQISKMFGEEMTNTYYVSALRKNQDFKIKNFKNPRNDKNRFLCQQKIRMETND